MPPGGHRNGKYSREGHHRRTDATTIGSPVIATHLGPIAVTVPARWTSEVTRPGHPGLTPIVGAVPPASQGRKSLSSHPLTRPPELSTPGLGPRSSLWTDDL